MQMAVKPEDTSADVLEPAAAIGRQVLVATNPTAGAGNAAALVDRLRRALIDRGFQVSVFAELDAAVAEALRLHGQGALRALVAAGGDGTVAELLNRTPAGLPLALLPLGTENLLATYLGIGRDAQRVADILVRGDSLSLDVGVARELATGRERLFFMMVGCGFDAEVVSSLHADRRGHIRHWSYVKPILSAIRNYRYPEIRVRCMEDGDGQAQESIAAAVATVGRWVFVTNVPRYAMGLRFAPQALGNDGLLDVSVFRRGSFWHGLRYLAGVISGYHLRWADVVSVRTRRVLLEADEPVRYQLDGDPGGWLPLEIHVLPGRLCLLAPPGCGSQSRPGCVADN
jgi:diacylglycerol kinase (ATP)